METPVKTLIFGFEQFPRTDGGIDIKVLFSSHVETVYLLQKSGRKPDTKVRINVPLEDYYRIKDAKKQDGE